VEDLSPGEPERHPLEGEDLVTDIGELAASRHKRSVEMPSATAFCKASTSASIQLW